MAVHPGRSLALYFPDVRPALLLAISKHDFDLGHLFKLDPQMKDRPKDSALQLSDTGVLIRAERDASPKEYPSFDSLHNPLHIYFAVIIHQLIMSSNTPALIAFTHGSSKYISSLYKLYLDYEWPQVLEYHFKFHNRRIVEMTEGNYGGWEQVDGGLMSIHLYGHPKIRPAKPGTMLPGTSNKDISKQTCNAYQYAKCTSPCKTGRIHKCRKCSSVEHGASACMKSE